jgi:hypothetical protein
MTLEWDTQQSSKKAAEFAWQSFVALNWPADEKGQPLKDTIIGQSPASPRVWECFASPNDTIWHDQCGEVLHGSQARPKSIQPDRQPLAAQLSKQEIEMEVGTDSINDREIGLETKNPLVDQQSNFVVYEIRINKDEFEQINGIQNPLCNAATVSQGIQAFEFAACAGKNGEAVVSPIELKSAWRVFDDRNSDAEKRSYYTTKKRVCIPANFSETGQELCEGLELGLIGFHIAQKFEWQKAEGKSWIWSTFEHVNNLEVQPETQQETPTLCKPTPTDSCSSIQAPPQPPEGTPQWNQKPPHARSPFLPIQVHRTTPIQSDAKKSNVKWRSFLKGVEPNSVWQNYQLIGTNFTPINNQCNPSNEATCLSATNPTTRLLNVALETYIDPLGGDPTKKFSNCASCHIKAGYKDGGKTDFSFLFSNISAN